MMFLGIIFGLGTIVAPIIVWIKTKGQKRRVLKAIGSSIACFILMGIFAVNDKKDYSTQPPTQEQQQTAQPKQEPTQAQDSKKMSKDEYVGRLEDISSQAAEAITAAGQYMIDLDVDKAAQEYSKIEPLYFQLQEMREQDKVPKMFEDAHYQILQGYGYFNETATCLRMAAQYEIGSDDFNYWIDEATTAQAKGQEFIKKSM